MEQVGKGKDPDHIRNLAKSVTVNKFYRKIFVQQFLISPNKE